MKSTAEPVAIDIITPQKKPVVYRPHSTIPFNEKELQFFKSLKKERSSHQNI